MSKSTKIGNFPARLGEHKQNYMPSDNAILCLFYERRFTSAAIAKVSKTRLSTDANLERLSGQSRSLYVYATETGRRQNRDV